MSAGLISLSVHLAAAYLVDPATTTPDSGVDLSGFLQYGVVGLVAVIALAAVRVLYKREVDEHDREKQRADRLEAELAKLNATVQNQTMQALNDATKAVAEALGKMRSR